ncbi:MAG TPA: PEP-CTERM sorting domain-containing protein [Methylophilaceae bacterium]|jgi:hypothetical protein
MEIFNKHITGLLLLVVCFNVHATTFLEIDSYGAPGNDPYASNVPWEVLGTQVFTPQDGIFGIGNPYPSNPANVNSVSISFMTYGGPDQNYGRWINIDFSTDQLGVPLGMGFYQDAQRFPFNEPGHPGLDITDTGSGYNTLTGEFEVYDVKFDTKAHITSFAASYKIFNYPAPAGSPSTGGRVWFNSDAIIPAPEPEVYAMILAGLGLIGFAARRKQK